MDRQCTERKLVWDSFYSISFREAILLWILCFNWIFFPSPITFFFFNCSIFLKTSQLTLLPHLNSPISFGLKARFVCLFFQHLSKFKVVRSLFSNIILCSTIIYKTLKQRALVEAMNGKGIKLFNLPILLLWLMRQLRGTLMPQGI